MGDNDDFAERVFGADAVGDAVSDHLRWYDMRLKGIDTGMDEEAPIKLFVMGANEWRYEQEWPLARTEWTDFFLSPTRQPRTDVGLGQWIHDLRLRPKGPVPLLGRSVSGSGPHRSSRPATDRGKTGRPGVRHTPPLTERMEVTGPVTAILFDSSDCPDTDFTAALVDVAVDGAAIILCEGICRAWFRYGVDRPALMDVGKSTSSGSTCGIRRTCSYRDIRSGRRFRRAISPAATATSTATTGSASKVPRRCASRTIPSISDWRHHPV